MQKQKIMSYFSGILALQLIIMSLSGIYIKRIYILETPQYALQGIAQDIFNVCIVAPVLLIARTLLQRKKIFRALLWSGTLLYVLYTFIIYSFTIHFNPLFLMYCMTLGLSAFLLFFGLSDAVAEIGPLHDRKTGIKFVANFLFTVAGLFTALWFKEIIPALLSGTVPLSAKEAGLITNPVHILDLSFFLPAMVIVGIGLKRGNLLATVFAPVLVVFSVIMALSLIVLIAYLRVQIAGSDTSPIIVFAGLLVAGIWALHTYSRGYE
jgi:hypothetical protein